MGIVSADNLRKTYYYLKKNGLKNVYYAALERIMSDRKVSYVYEVPKEEGLQRQREEGTSYRFSILVPAYETKTEYLREMADSVLNQSYGNLELIVADASKSDKVEKVLAEYTDERLRYIRLTENKGIAENTNAALKEATGDYIGLLDHDDVLTPDALYEMARAVKEEENKGNAAWMLYSDEDKGDGELARFYEPHKKTELNVDLLLSNNYICHFLVMKRELMQELGFRGAYNGAQDYDLVLRAVGRLVYESRMGRKAVVHIPKVLYHWRCHTDSTAANPESKRYAYEAGRRALEDFMKARGWKGRVEHTLHLGFYGIVYEENILKQRNEVGVIGGRLIDRNGKIAGGIYDEEGNCPYQGLRRNFSGYMHRAALAQEAYAVDVRCMRMREEMQGIFKDVFGVSYREYAENPEKVAFDNAEREKEFIELCLEFGQRVRQEGYTLVWTPEDEVRI